MKVAWWVLGIALNLVVQALSADLPPAPAGFAWESLAEINARILKPAGWALKHHNPGNSDTYNLSPVGGATNQPSPAFALNWVRDVPGRTQLSPSKYAAALTDAAAQDHRLEDRVTTRQGAFVVTSFRYKESAGGRAGTMLRYQFWANDRTGSLYVGAFEAPASQWELAWKVGRVVTESLRLDESR